MFYTVLIAGLIDFIDFTNMIDLNQCITFRLIKKMPLFAFAFYEFLKVEIRITIFVTSLFITCVRWDEYSKFSPACIFGRNWFGLMWYLVDHCRGKKWSVFLRSLRVATFEYRYQSCSRHFKVRMMHLYKLLTPHLTPNGPRVKCGCADADVERVNADIDANINANPNPKAALTCEIKLK